MAATDGSLVVDVAATAFQIHGLEGELDRWARERYAQFLTERQADVHVTTRVVDVVSDDDTPPSIDIADDHLRMCVGGYHIEGDLKTGRVALEVPRLPAALSPAAFRMLSAVILLRAGGLMLHACAVVERGTARVFCGPSGSGKTTIAALAGPRRVLSDESVALRPQGATYHAWATPFFGENGPVATQATGAAPLGALFFLKKGARFAHRRLERREAAERAFPQVFVVRHSRPLADAMLAALDAVTAAAPAYELEFAASPALWEYVDALV